MLPEYDTVSEEEKLQAAEPGSLVLIKDFWRGFRKVSDPKLGVQLATPGKDPTQLAFLLSIDVIETKLHTSYYAGTHREVFNKHYKLRILFNEQIYETDDLPISEVCQKFDFMKPPPRAASADGIDDWLTEYFGAQGRIFSVCKTFRARRGDSREIVKHYGKLPDRTTFSTGFAKTFHIRHGEKIVAVGMRRHAARRILIFDFFVNGVLCWFEFNSSSTKKHSMFRDYFYSVGGETPYEKDVRVAREKQNLRENGDAIARAVADANNTASSSGKDDSVSEDQPPF